MGKICFTDLINIGVLKKMTENLYAASGIPIGIMDKDLTIHISVGWQDICTKYHRIHPSTHKRCLISNNYIKEHLKDGGYISYKCLNNMWDVAMPIIIADEHIATIFFGQFFYEEEVVDIECFRAQALEFGFDEKEYLAALKRVPIFSKEKVEHIIEYYLGLITMLSESGLRLLECKNSQKELEKSQEYLNTIFNSVNDAICIHDGDGNIIDVNETTTYMFGYSYKELISMNVKDIVPECAYYTVNNVFELINKPRSSEPVILELIAKNKRGEEFWVEVNTRIAKIGGEDRFLVAIRNITERKQTEFALQKEALEMELVRTEFFANISHELRTPLNIILGSMQNIELNIQDEEKPINKGRIMNNINIQRQNCFRLLRLINNLIDSTKLDSCDFELSRINCNIVNIVEEVTLSVAEYVNLHNLNLVFDTDVEEKIIACDLDKIERIMLNLLSNSVKFTEPGGSIFVNVFNGEEYIRISVEDTGIGIPKDKLSMIFDRFRQVDKSFTRNHEGSGIGLSLVKSLVEMHGGTIFVESEYGKGSKFLILLPVEVLDFNNNEERTKLVHNRINTFVERAKIEFSDIYK